MNIGKQRFHIRTIGPARTLIRPGTGWPKFSSHIPPKVQQYSAPWTHIYIFAFLCWAFVSQPSTFLVSLLSATYVLSFSLSGFTVCNISSWALLVLVCKYRYSVLVSPLLSPAYLWNLLVSQIHSLTACIAENGTYDIVWLTVNMASDVKIFLFVRWLHFVRCYSGSGVLFVLKRVFVSFRFVSFSLCFVFNRFSKRFLPKNAFYVSPIPWLWIKRFFFNQPKKKKRLRKKRSKRESVWPINYVFKRIVRNGKAFDQSILD